MISNQSWKKFWIHKKSTFLEKVIFFFKSRFVSKTMASFLIKHSEKGSILEAGSGSGLSSILVAKTRGDLVTLCDVVEEPFTLSKKYAKEMNVSINTQVCDIHKMDVFEDKEFDIVWNIGTIEHFKEPLNALSEMNRCGKVSVVIVPEYSVFWNLFYKFSKLLRRIDDDFFVHFYKKKELEKVFIKTPFKKIEIYRIRVLFFIPYLAVLNSK